MLAITACAALVVLAAAGAEAAKIEHLGQPCRAKNVLAGRVVVDRADGRERLVLANMNEDTGAELIFIDFERDTGKVFRAPAGSGSWALNEVSRDRLVVGTFYDGRFMVFDLRKMEFIQNVDFPGETYIWNLAMGSDGRIYGGTYNGGKLGALDLDTYAVEDCGAPAPPNLYLRYVSPMPDGRIVCHFFTEKPTTLIYDPAAKQFTAPPKHLAGVVQCASWNGYLVAGSQICDGKTLDPVDPPFQAPPKSKGKWSIEPYLTTEDTLFLRQGNAVYRCGKGQKSPTRIFDIDLRGGRILAGTSRGEVVGVRGQDYFVIKPGDTDLSLKPIPVESGPRPTMFLRVDGRGRIWGGPHFGQTLFWMDPATKEVTNTSTICDAGGEVYDVTFLNGKVYAASYAGGDIVCYDPDQPWDQWNRGNPKVIADVGEKGYIRPTAGIRVGPDGRLYSGWMIRYGKYGGAIAITDPATGSTELIEDPLGEQAIAGIAVGDGLIYAGTSLGANGLPNKPNESARFGIIDIKARNVIFEQVMDGASSVRVLACDPATKRVAVAVQGAMRLFDAAERRFMPDLAASAPPLTCTSVPAPVEGRLYYASGSALVALDMASGSTSTVAEAPAKIHHVAIGPDGAIYIACWADIYAVTPGANQ